MKTNWVREIKDKQRYLKGWSHLWVLLFQLSRYIYVQYLYNMQGWGPLGIALRPEQTGWLGCSLTRLYTIALGIFRVHQKVGNIFQLKRKTTAEKQNQTEQNTALIVFSAGGAVWDGQTDTKSFRTWLTTKVKRGQSVWIRFEHIDRWLNGWQTCEPTIEAAQQKTKHRKLCQHSSVCVCV